MAINSQGVKRCTIDGMGFTKTSVALEGGVWLKTAMDTTAFLVDPEDTASVDNQCFR